MPSLTQRCPFGKNLPLVFDIWSIQLTSAVSTVVATVDFIQTNHIVQYIVRGSVFFYNVLCHMKTLCAPI